MQLDCGAAPATPGAVVTTGATATATTATRDPAATATRVVRRLRASLTTRATNGCGDAGSAASRSPDPGAVVATTGATCASNAHEVCLVVAIAFAIALTGRSRRGPTAA